MKNTPDGYGLANDDVWFAPAGITNTANLTAGSTMTSAAGDDTIIASPTVEGDYHLYVVDAAGNISSASTATLTVTAFDGGSFKKYGQFII